MLELILPEIGEKVFKNRWSYSIAEFKSKTRIDYAWRENYLMKASSQFPVKIDLLFGKRPFEKISINRIYSITRDGYQIWMADFTTRNLWGLRDHPIEIYSPIVVPHGSYEGQVIRKG